MRRNIGLGILIAAAIPFPQTTTAAWTAEVVAESGVPQANITVHEIWQNYTLERGPHYDQRITDVSGRVTFPRRVLWRPLAVNAWGTMRNALHGPVAYLDVSEANSQSFVDKCFNSRMVLRPITIPRVANP
jgi:hypothetical protein